MDTSNNLTSEGRRNLNQIQQRLLVGRGKPKIRHISCGIFEGGLYELLESSVRWERRIGLDSGWVNLDSTAQYSNFCLTLHNLLHGKPDGTEPPSKWYSEIRNHLPYLVQELAGADMLVLHDPQTAGLVEPLRSLGFPLIWRSHVGTAFNSKAREYGWSLLKPLVQPADLICSTKLSYLDKSIAPEKVREWVPFVDHQSYKNRSLPYRTRLGLLKPLNISEECYISQISRWDALKGADQLIRSSGLLSRKAPASLKVVVAGPKVIGDSASESYARLSALSRCYQRTILTTLGSSGTKRNNLTVNALQTSAAVIVQNSFEEAFGMSITEAMWKQTCVVARDIPGIRLQIQSGFNSVLLDPKADDSVLAHRIESLLLDPNYRHHLGVNAKETVRKNFLVDQHLQTLMSLFDQVSNHRD